MNINNLLKVYKEEVAIEKAKENKRPLNHNPLIQRAVNMRLSGMLFKDIGAALGVEKSCASIWCKGLIDSDTAAKLTASGKLIGMKLRLQAKADRQETIKEIISANSKISAREIGRMLDVHGTTISKDIKEIYGERL